MTPRPALRTVPKTVRESLVRALRYANKNVVAQHVYADDAGNLCIIGQFFTPDQLEYLRTRKSSDCELVEKILRQ